MSAAPQKPGAPQSPGNPNPSSGPGQRSPEAMVAAAAAAAREGTDATAGDESEEQLARAWGLTERRPRMSREAMIGLLAVVALLGLFGFVAWKKYNGRTTVVTNSNPDPNVKTPESLEEPTKVATTNFDKNKPEKPNDDFSLGFGDSDLDEQRKPPKPKQILDETLDIGESQSEPAMNEPADDDPFSKPAKKTATIELDDPDEEPPPKPREPARLQQPRSRADDFEEPVRVAVTPQKTRKPTRLPDVDQFADNSQTTISELSPTSDLPPAKNSGRHPLLRENEYLVESGDSFCAISKKLYGTGRYYLALAEANKKRVADPCRMRPGLIISAPPRETLERQFAELIPETRRTADADADQDKAEAPKGAKRPNATAQAPGLFRDDNGIVWYRVGEGDTLSEIADHFLGRMSRAEMIVNLNRERLPDPNNLKIGQVLRMPNDASPVRLTETDREIR